MADAPISAEQLAGLIARIADNTISNNIAKKVFEGLWNGEGSTADEIIDILPVSNPTVNFAVAPMTAQAMASWIARNSRFMTPV